MVVAVQDPRAVRPELERLTCGNCGASVPLADADAVPCPHCGGAVAMPVAYRRAFLIERKDAATRAEARRLYAELGTPPGRWLRFLSIAFNGWWLLFGGGFVMMCASLFVVDFAFFMIGDACHENVVEVMPVREQRALQFPPAIALAAVGAALGVYGRRHARSRRRLQAALAAKPPGRAGGPAICRTCGGPLAVEAGALGVRCVYCGSDNLVALPPSWIAKVGADVATIGAEIEPARVELTRERARLRRGLVLHVGGIGVGFALFFLACLSGTHEPPADTGVVPPGFAGFSGDPRPLVRRGLDDAKAAKLAAAPLSAHYTRLDFPNGCPQGAAPLELAPRDCDAKGCALRLYAALHAGEHVAVTFAGLPSGATVEVSRHSVEAWPKRSDARFGERVARLAIAPDVPSTFVARWTAWHELLLRTTGERPTGARVCFTVSR
ncbi:MAG TPA: hypothetical protein VHB21_16745 [Minicystis sp.]|nr:hypothetical protein [Minicystis sp.]